MMKKIGKIIAGVVALAFILAGCNSNDSSEDASETMSASSSSEMEASVSLLETVKNRGEVYCGTRDALPGFAVLESNGEHVGFDSDFCRVIAAAILGDANAVKMVDLETADRFTALQRGSVDVLVRNTTWTASRDGNEGATFLHPTFYDGQGMMVSAGSSYRSISDMSNAVVCVAKGTTTEGNAANESTRLGLNWEVRPFDDPALIQEAFLAGQCDGWSSDVSQLAALRSSYPSGTTELRILSDVFSKEPLAPAVLDGDTAWAQAVDWAILATMQAEEYGITQANVDTMRDSTDNPGIKTFLGVSMESDSGTTVLDPGLGLPTDFAYQVVKQVGNYGEIFERHIAPLGIDRGKNAIWNDGGLLYAPPFR